MTPQEKAAQTRAENKEKQTQKRREKKEKEEAIRKVLLRTITDPTAKRKEQLDAARLLMLLDGYFSEKNATKYWGC